MLFCFHIDRRGVAVTAHIRMTRAAFPQDVQDQEASGQEAEAEQAHPSVDSPEDRQHHSVRRTSLGSRRSISVEFFLWTDT